MIKVTRDELMHRLGNCIASAPQSERQQLAEALTAYAKRYRFTYRNLTSSDTLIAALLDTLEEATDARIERDGSGVPI